ncbi:hypothetical protein LDENG_00171880 [Lucifuga dentata]|nr:hypothetical protein LDENG_00171880 [Lucifuga dentata]
MYKKHFKPNLSHSQVSEMVKRLYRLTPSAIHSLPSYDDQNFHLAGSEGGEYILKIMNSEDSKSPALLEVQTYTMIFLHQHGLPTQTVLPTTTGQLMTLEEISKSPVTQFRSEG